MPCPTPVSAREASAANDGVDPRIWTIAWVVLLGPLMTSLDSTVVNVSLGRLGQELHAPLTTIQWVISGYLLALALILPLCGWLVDRVGAKRVYLGCFTAFTAASMACGLAASAAALIGFRVLQGMAGGLLVPMAQLMTARGAGRQMARIMGLMSMPVLLGPICGPALAGFILQHASWRWIFFINLPIGLLALLLAIWILPRDDGLARPRPFDLAGFAMLSPGLALLLHSLESLGAGRSAHHLAWLELAAALGLLAAFLRHGRRLGGAALVDLRLFRRPAFAAAACTQFLANAGAIGGQMLLALCLLMARRSTPAQAGMLLVPIGLGMFCSLPAMGRLTGWFGPRRVAAAGALLALAGTLPFAWAGFAAGPAWLLCIALFVRGMGQGGIAIPSIAVAYEAIPGAQIPVATTAINIVQRLGGPVAATALALFLHTRMGAVAPGLPLGPVFAATFRLLCALHVVTLLAALRLPAWPGPAQAIER